MMEHFKAFYHPGGQHPNGGPSAHFSGWYWLAPDHYGETSLYSGREKYPPEYEADAQKQADQHKYHRHWSEIWRQALENMPYRVSKKPKWVAQTPGTTPFAIVARGVPTGKVRLEGGVVLIEEGYHYGQRSLLARLLGYYNTNKLTGERTAHTNRIYSARYEGNQPRNPTVRDLLLKFASPEGNAIAWNMLEKMGKARHYHRP